MILLLILFHFFCRSRMSQVKDKLSFKSELCVFVSLVFAAIHLIQCGCEAQPQAIGPSQPVVATLGDATVLPCHLEPSSNAAPETVEWLRPDLNTRFVFVFRNGTELKSEKHPSYRGRTSLNVDGLKLGDISLRLSGVQLSDEGTYRCFIPTLGIEANMDLVVSSVPSPLTVGINRVGGEVMLESECAGWYPEPEVLWRDAEGNIVSAGPTETLRGPDGLCTVSSSVTVATNTPTHSPVNYKTTKPTRPERRGYTFHVL
ncbi:butyrophilin subfamily 1 member A1-like [Genypterus blacodes]|uniref:butyrophilin subfamily 1 member A1-like n=1 Tax=Genypterus blacodes TaxID=154954 RepID=UPI003F76D610